MDVTAPLILQQVAHVPPCYLLCPWSSGTKTNDWGPPCPQTAHSLDGVGGAMREGDRMVAKFLLGWNCGPSTNTWGRLT